MELSAYGDRCRHFLDELNAEETISHVFINQRRGTGAGEGGGRNIVSGMDYCFAALPLAKFTAQFHRSSQKLRLERSALCKR